MLVLIFWNFPVVHKEIRTSSNLPFSGYEISYVMVKSSRLTPRCIKDTSMSRSNYVMFSALEGRCRCIEKALDICSRNYLSAPAMNFCFGCLKTPQTWDFVGIMYIRGAGEQVHWWMCKNCTPAASLPLFDATLRLLCGCRIPDRHELLNYFMLQYCKKMSTRKNTV